MYWNIPDHAYLYVFFVVMAAVFLYGFYRHYRLWRLGRPVRLTPLGPRFRRLLAHAGGQARVVRRRHPGLSHAALFYAYAMMTVGTIVVALNSDLGLPVMQGPFYLWFESLGLDVAGVVAIAALVLFGIGRRRRDPRPAPADKFIYTSFLVVLVTGFVLESLRLYAAPVPWAAFSPVGDALARLYGDLHMSTAAALATHRALWWFHMAVAFSFMAAWPYSRLRHILFAPLAIFLSDPEERPLPPEVDFEEAERLGADMLADLTVKDLVDLDACTECNRCEEACPAFASGKPLSPKAVILDLREQMHRSPKASLSAAISDEALFACTTCRACMEACPVDIEHVPKILAMRQFRVMEAGSVPKGLDDALAGIEERGHPFRGATATRTSWYRDLPGVKTWEPGEHPDVLLWVGCAGAFDPQAQGIVRALARLMIHMDEDFRVLGERECCTGDLARRSGQEFLYDGLAHSGVDLLAEVAPREIVTICPHCLQQLKHEYGRLGLDVQVTHHSEYLARALRQGRLRPEAASEAVTFHDPCYLGRYNGVFEAPREVVAAAASLREMGRSGRASFCCGGGGGRAFAEEEGTRINRLRAAEAVGTGAAVVATACPFCLLMMRDGVKAEAGDGVGVKDIAEILAERMGMPGG